jgi:hypothetical protein
VRERERERDEEIKKCVEFEMIWRVKIWNSNMEKEWERHMWLKVKFKGIMVIVCHMAALEGMGS